MEEWGAFVAANASDLSCALFCCSGRDPAGRAAEAVPLFKRVRDRLMATLGPDHRDTLIALNNLAWAHAADGSAAEAIQLYDRVRERASAIRGPDHPFTLDVLESLASTLSDQGIHGGLTTS